MGDLEERVRDYFAALAVIMLGDYTPEILNAQITKANRIIIDLGKEIERLRTDLTKSKANRESWFDNMRSHYRGG